MKGRHWNALTGMVVLIFAMVPLAQGQAFSAARRISVLGATSMLPMLQAEIPVWERHHPGYSVALAGGGSLAGLMEVSRGHVDLGLSDIPMPQNIGRMGVRSVILGKMPIVFIVNTAARVHDVNFHTLQAILEGRITHWNQIGGSRLPIIVVTRPTSSGARYMVNRQILQGRAITGYSLVQLSNGAVLRTVRETPGAIGYIEASYLMPNVSTLSINHVSYTASNAAHWPYYAEPSLLIKRGAPTMVSKFVRFLKTRPLTRYGIYPLPLRHRTRG